MLVLHYITVFLKHCVTLHCTVTLCYTVTSRDVVTLRVTVRLSYTVTLLHCITLLLNSGDSRCALKVCFDTEMILIPFRAQKTKKE